MKTNNSIILFLLTALFIGFVACSKDNDEILPPTPEKKEVPTLSLKENSIALKVDNQATIDITQGGGAYKAFTLNPDVATVELNENKLILTGHNNGKTDLIVSDDNNQYRKMSIIVYTYDEVKLSRLSVLISFKHGERPEPTRALITQGNGLYSVTSDHEDIVTISLQQGDAFSIIPTGKEGKATITVTDFMGISATLPVEVVKSINPFTNNDIKTITNSSTLRYSFSNGELIQGGIFNYVRPYYQLENGIIRCGYKTMTTEYDPELQENVDVIEAQCELSFAGDNSIGVKENGTISYKSGNFDNDHEEVFTDQPTNIEIIKNDGKKMWGIFYFINGEKLFYGHFCQNAR